jgi:hypothetical protein
MSESARLMYRQEMTIETQTVATEMSGAEQRSFRDDRAEETLYVARRHLGRGRMSRGNEWSSEDLRALRELASIGTPLETIATTLRRTTSAVRNKAGMHGISLKARRSAGEAS